VFPKIVLLHKVVRDAKKVEKHCFRAEKKKYVSFTLRAVAVYAFLCSWIQNIKNQPHVTRTKALEEN